VPSTLVVNLGEMLAKMTGNQLKATKHRVLDIGVERFSCPFFFEPFYLAMIPDSIFEAEVNSEHEGPGSKGWCLHDTKIENKQFNYGDYVIDKMRIFGESKDFGKTPKTGY
jgi:isopenicillin N synthase-like dioxygenase